MVEEFPKLKKGSKVIHSAVTKVNSMESLISSRSIADLEKRN